MATQDFGRDLGRKRAGSLTTRGILGVTCLMLLCGLLYAGLVPFRAPSNDVAWVAGSNAIRFADHGTMLSSGLFPPPAHGEGERSIEIWAQPGLIDDSSTMMAFYSPASARGLSIVQAESDLEVRIESSSAWRHEKIGRLNIADAFLDGKSAFWAVTFGTSGTAVYRDSKLVRSSPLAPSNGELSGRLVVGSSPIFHDGWSGVERGLAIYDAALNPAQIERHYLSWTHGGAPALAPGDLCVAVYLFDEHAGRVVHNRAGSENDLIIPEKFLILRQTVLDPVWRAFNWSRGFWKDAFINVGGFVPFGFFLCAYFSVRGLRSPVLCASVPGAAVSLIIELTQAHLPTRDSSMSDVINNAFGSILGAAAYRGALAREVDRWTCRIVSLGNGVWPGIADRFRQ